jgi:serine/threonine protein phosphatase PrpC
MIEMNKCPNCGHENRQTAQYCQGCGATLLSPAYTNLDTQPIILPPAAQRPTPIPSSDTRPLSTASMAFAPLPEGALLHDGRYLVLELRDSNEHLNTYLVEDTVSVRLCFNCQAQTHDPQEKFCPSCGADLAGVEPLRLHYQIMESISEQAFAVESQLLKMHLRYPGLLLPHDAFEESPYGPIRHYLVESELALPLATSLSIPQDLNQVLEWGASLARAMDHLHQRHIVLGEVNLKQIALPGKKAHWTHLGAANIIPPQTCSTETSLFAQDVQRLAELLLFLAAGRGQDAHPPLPQPAATAFTQALTAPTGITAAAFAEALEASLHILRRPTSVTLSVGRRTDVGQERSLNEDSLLTMDVAPVYRSSSTPVGLFVVADGMGGHSAGDVASRMAIQAVQQRAVDDILVPAAAGNSLPAPREWLTTAMRVANQSVFDQRQAAGTDMGTTMVMALFIGDAATIANVGDSRAYLLTQDKIVQITTDHSLVERLVATGQISREEAALHPQKNIIYRVIGDKHQAEADIFSHQLAAGEALLLCSDGLSGMVPDSQVWQIWRTATSPQDACDRLVEAANQAGGMDNISVIIVQVNQC